MNRNEPWSSPEIVARLSATPPNAELMQFAKEEQQRGAGRRLLDIGCGAGCNAVPLARMGWDVLGLDLSEPMLEAARQRLDDPARLQLQLAPMDRLPVEDQSFDFIVAHGIWNLARSAQEFRTAVREASRAAKSGAPLFVYTFSRSTLPPEAAPLNGESFVFNEFSGRPQCFLTERQLIEELEAAEFESEPGHPITEYAQQEAGPKPAIYEGIFRRISAV